MGGGGAPGYQATWYPAQPVSGQASEFTLVRQGLSIGAPIWRGEKDMVLANTSVRGVLFATDAVLPDSQRPFPAQLWSVNIGINYLHQFDGGWSGGLMIGGGSASDQPFDSLAELTATLMAFLRIPAGNGRDTWQFMLLYLSGGPVAFPFPMLSYAWAPSAQLQVNLGLPFSVAWQPREDWTLNLSYVPLNNVNARLTYRVAPQLQVYGGYEFLNESYFLADRTDAAERFFAFEQRLLTGWRWEVWQRATLDLNTGYAFGRHFGSGDSQWGSLTDRVDIAPGVFLGISFRWRF